MTNYLLPQNDSSPLRSASLQASQQYYQYDTTSLGIPLCKFPDPIRDTGGPEWLRQVLDISLRVRANMKSYMAKTPFKFANPFPPDFTNFAFLKFVLGSVAKGKQSILQSMIDTGSNIFEVVLPDLGPGGAVSSIQQFKDLFVSVPLPEVAGRFETDDSFANNFVAGPNPNVLQRMTQVPANFPISNLQFQAVAQFAKDDLTEAMQSGRVYYIDHSDMQVLNNGSHYGVVPKYIYAPFAAFAVPLSGGRLVPFAIQCGPTPAGRQIYTPTDGYSWKIAKNCVLAAHNTHHELVSHLGLTHYLMEPMVMATRRQLSDQHPVYALLNHHFEGTMLINYGATHNLTLPTRSVDRLVGADLNSCYAYIVANRLNYSFTGNYLPTRFSRLQTDDANALSYYPYRDDALLIWNAVAAWTADFVSYFYSGDADVTADFELQNWASEITTLGQVKDFGATPGQIQSRQDLINILTMLVFTAGPQHAAVNFAQGTDLVFPPANPLAGFTPEPTGLGHTQQDWLNNLPPIEVGITSIDLFPLLAGVYYTTLGHYADDPSALMSDFGSGPLNALVQKFQANLVQIEQQITARNQTRLTPYLHLLPSRIPQSTNI